MGIPLEGELKWQENRRGISRKKKNVEEKEVVEGKEQTK